MKTKSMLSAFRPWLLRVICMMTLLSGSAVVVNACEWVVDGINWTYDPEYYWIEGHYDWVPDGEGGQGIYTWIEGHFEGEWIANPYGHWEGEDCD